MDVCVEESDPELGPVIVAYRRRVNPNGRRGGRGTTCELFPINDNDTYPIHIQDIINMTAQYIADNPSERNTSHAVQLQTKVQ